MVTEANAAEQEDAAAAAQEVALTPGAILAQERVRQELSEKEVADKLHITMHYVRSVEADRYDKLPGAVFAKGYIKSYAELLGLDSSELLSAYGELVNNREARKEENQRKRSQRRRARNLPWVYASVGAFVGGFALLWLLNFTGTG
ncbi:MAG: helix-turn-helix domain-containing protein, partial [Gammaproteobacteria bacterium]